MNLLLEIVFILGLLIAYIAIGVILIKSIMKSIPTSNKWLRLIVSSFLIALFFGVGIFGGSQAEPGFALPAPIVIALVFNTLEGNGLRQIVNGSLLPLIIWWIIISVVGYLKASLYPKIKSSKQT